MSIIEEVVAKLADWKGRDISIQQLSGGLTNTNYKVIVDGTPFFIRVPGASTELLAIDRANEYHSSKAAAQAGIGPKVLYYLPEYSVMVLEFLNGKTMSKDALNESGMSARMAASIKRLHAGERFLLDFKIFCKFVSKHNPMSCMGKRQETSFYYILAYSHNHIFSLRVNSLKRNSFSIAPVTYGRLTKVLRRNRYNSFLFHKPG